jgi:glyoxylase-like metal-dependent hydrolase (beta-lactamase superfamily II)
VYTGDILFIGGHPAVWAGPVSNWIAACDRILGWDVETIVPGHGPITDKAGVRRLRDYFVHVSTEARMRFDADTIALLEASEWWTLDKSALAAAVAAAPEFAERPSRATAPAFFAALNKTLP